MRVIEMKLNRKEVVTLEMGSSDFDSLMFYLQRSGTQTLLDPIDARGAEDMYNLLRGLNKQ